MKQLRNIKIYMTKIFIVACALIVFQSILFNGGNIEAKAVTHDLSASEVKHIKKLVQRMNQFEIYEINSNLRFSSEKLVKLTSRNMAQAAALSISVKNLKETGKKGDFGGNVTWKLTNSRLKSASKIIFGKSVTTAKLRKVKSESEIMFPADVYRTAKGNPVVYYADAETEQDYSIIKISISPINSDVYKVVKKFYLGYWGSNHGTPNYMATYRVKKDSRSSYGYVIKNMKLTNISD